MSSWGYTELNTWPQEPSSSNLPHHLHHHHHHHHQQQQQQVEQELLLSTTKRLRRDQEQAECGGGLWSLRVPTSDLDGMTAGVVPESFQGVPEAGGLRSSSRFYMDETSFLDSDGAVSSSCHFALSDVGARIGLFSHQASSQKEMDDSWEAINNLGDMDDIFGNTSSYVQPSSLSLEQSLSSQTAVTAAAAAAAATASPPTPSSSSVIMLNSSHQLVTPAVNDCGRELGDFRDNSMQVSNTLDLTSALPSSTANGKATTYQRADINMSPVIQGSKNSMFGTQVSRRLESYYPPPLVLPTEPLPLQTPNSRQQQQLESGVTGNYHPQAQAVMHLQDDGLLQPWSERRETNSSATTSSSAGNEASSLEAAVFYQLASTMAKLDVRTRLCIRNALYRLAKSASSRNRDIENDLGCKYPSRNPEIACLETCTNPIDRTVASLLFYKHDQQQQTQQTVATAAVTTQQDTSSGSVSPHSAISSNSCVTQLGPELKLRTSLAAPLQPTSRPEVPVMMANGSTMIGNKLPLPPLRYNRNNRRLG